MALSHEMEKINSKLNSINEQKSKEYSSYSIGKKENRRMFVGKFTSKEKKGIDRETVEKKVKEFLENGGVIEKLEPQIARNLISENENSHLHWEENDDIISQEKINGSAKFLERQILRVERE
tara:strand:- start:544 stop:909 length:366 start_codon:yes stop_codon:yes gene_type:complete